MRGTFKFVGGVVLLMLALALGYFLVLGRSGDVLELASDVTPRPEERGRVVRADGVVELRVGNQPWTAAAEGTAFAAGASMRTGIGGRATISYGDGVRVEVEDSTSVRLERVDDKTVRFKVNKGLVIIDVDKNKTSRVIQLTAENSDAVIETRDGRIAVLSDGKGQVQTAVIRGGASFSAKGKKILLKAGEQSLAVKGKAPSASEPIPESLLLKVKWPPVRSGKRRHLIKGKTTPGSLVRVGNRVVAADATGRFSALVELHEGRNSLVVRAVDIIARREQSTANIKVDTKAPSLKVKTDPSIWGK